MKKALSFIIPVLACFAVGWTASYFQADSLANWYPYLNKPTLTPPNFVFPIAWGILYLCMGISIGLIYNTPTPRRKFFVTLFAIQLFFNFTWSISFFTMQNPMLGLINILVLDLLVIYYAIDSWRVNRAASVLFWPYVLWLGFATYLNIFILMHN